LGGIPPVSPGFLGGEKIWGGRNYQIPGQLFSASKMLTATQAGLQDKRFNPEKRARTHDIHKTAEPHKTCRHDQIRVLKNGLIYRIPESVIVPAKSGETPDRF